MFAEPWSAVQTRYFLPLALKVIWHATEADSVLEQLLE
jgi:hypothetical protein